MPIEILLTLVACHLNFVSIDNDYVVATIHVRSERRLVFATQTCCNNRCKTAQNNALGVDDDPLLVDVCWRCRECFHRR